MPRYIDADKAIEYFEKHRRLAIHKDDIVAYLADSSAIDVQEVVRCKNCRFFDKYDKVEDFDGQCVVRDCETDKEEFCSYGSKRDDEK